MVIELNQNQPSIEHLAGNIEPRSSIGEIWLDTRDYTVAEALVAWELGIDVHPKDPDLRSDLKRTFRSPSKRHIQNFFTTTKGRMRLAYRQTTRSPRFVAASLKYVAIILF